VSIYSPIVSLVDEVFRALNDPGRRLLLDRLFVEDGQTLLQLSSYLPQMTRFGVMSHLRVLEEAQLVATRKVGRNKRHYLNPVPIRRVHDRWISKYTAPFVGALSDLKSRLEEGVTQTMSGPVHVYQVFIGCPVDDVWRAIIDGQFTEQYYFGTKVDSEWEVGSDIKYFYPDGSIAADGRVNEIDAPHRLDMTFHPRWDPEIEAAGPTRMVWLVESVNGMARLSVELHDVTPGSRTYEEFVGGLTMIVSGLKTLLETGKPLAAAS
jgi:uncharacterized protein YndB with AHSA1/START domain/DNA-binding transcriptional ArsR family regulator